MIIWSDAQVSFSWLVDNKKKEAVLGKPHLLILPGLTRFRIMTTMMMTMMTIMTMMISMTLTPPGLTMGQLWSVRQATLLANQRRRGLWTFFVSRIMRWWWCWIQPERNGVEICLQMPHFLMATKSTHTTNGECMHVYTVYTIKDMTRCQISCSMRLHCVGKTLTPRRMH